MSDSLCILFAAGGTSGHIHPALALAKAVRAKYPEAQIVFCGTALGLESRVVPEAGFAFQPIEAKPFPLRPSLTLFHALRAYREGKRECLELIRRYKPQVVVGTGGYVCGPLLAAARKLGVPTLIHEQNAYPGRSNRYAGRRADTVCISYEEAGPYFKRAKRLVRTGNPVRPEYFSLPEDACARARRDLGLPEEGPVVLISGGSLGARSLNKAAVEWAEKHPDFPGTVILASGSRLYEETQALAAEKNVKTPALRIMPYLHNMPKYMVASDLIIGRAGAVTCAEICALGKPSILIPYPYAAGDHQRHNAQVLCDRGAAQMVLDAEWDGEKLEAALENLLHNPGDWRKKGEAARELSDPDAVDKLLGELLKLVVK